MTTQLFFSILGGYFLGSIPFTQLIAKWRKGIDLRIVGSQNVGGMNTINNVGLGWGLFAGMLDVFKGVAALVFAEKMGLVVPQSLWAGMAAIAGHNWPVWLGFRGGKGIAVSIGLAAYVAFPETLQGFIIAFLMYWLVKRNIVITTLVMLLSTAVLMLVHQYPHSSLAVLWGSLLIMAIATLPSFVKTLRSKDGLRGYFKEPNKVYLKDQQKGE